MQKHCEEVNLLNVFPVPDGDTGSNMQSTMSGGIEALNKSSSNSVGVLASEMANGMLYGARGNSGVILSQFFSGFSKGLQGLEECNLVQFAQALELGVKQAYLVVVKPVEGTILTVMREGCDKALASLDSVSTFADYFTALLSFMKESLEHTPDLLPVLKEAGVIDSGGAGLVYIMEGMAQAIGGKIIEDVSLDLPSSTGNVAEEAFGPDSELDYGYCTEFILQLSNEKDGPDRFDLDAMIKAFSEWGDSIVAFRDDTKVKAHIHTKTPDKVISYAREYGEFITFKMENMALQHNETMIEKSRKRGKVIKPTEKRVALSTVAVVPNPEIGEIFTNYGIKELILGGPTMNPGAEDFVQAISKANADNVFVLPNNKNEILVAHQAAKLVKDCWVYVIPTRDIGEGIGCASVMSSDAFGKEENLEAAEKELASCVSFAVAKATRASSAYGLRIRKGDYLGLLSNHVVCNGAKLEDVLKQLIAKVDGFEDKNVITVVYGKSVDETVRERFSEIVAEGNDFIEFYALDGGNSIYDIYGVID